MFVFLFNVFSFLLIVNCQRLEPILNVEMIQTAGNTWSNNPGTICGIYTHQPCVYIANCTAGENCFNNALPTGLNPANFNRIYVGKAADCYSRCVDHFGQNTGRNAMGYFKPSQANNFLTQYFAIYLQNQIQTDFYESSLLTAFCFGLNRQNGQAIGSCGGSSRLVFEYMEEFEKQYFDFQRNIDLVTVFSLYGC
mmetsp:Transcript_22405/g.38279  ORF Transcript_22405/g.38279 Transcript_22405/m.38279 type:complete len:195 (-) Transcript_22405:9-593(-)